MNVSCLDRLVTEIDALYRAEAQHGVPARLAVGTLIADYLYSFIPYEEPPIPEYPVYVWPKRKPKELSE
jgi:hypothetical protein